MTVRVQEPELAPEHKRQLARAFKQLEKADFALRLTDYAGKPIQGALQKLPKSMRAAVDRATERAILQCLKLALKSLKAPQVKRPPRTRLSAALAGVAGGVGGVFGAAALPLELPVTTVLMLRSIAEIARHHGEDLSKLEARLACVQVFAFTGGGSPGRPDVGYYAARALLGKISGQASSLLIERGAASLSAPVVAALTGEIASRFGVVVWEKIAASALPLAGAAGAATINVVFMNHFQSVAHGHFTLRRLERLYGADAIQKHYRQLAKQGASDDRTGA